MAAVRESRGSKDPRAEELGRRVAARRKELGLSRRDVVAASGLSYPYVSQLETGYRLPSHKSLGRLARALQLDPAELSAAIAYDELALSAPHLTALSAHTHSDSVWMVNPDYAGSPTASRTPRVRVNGVVDQVVALVGALPVDGRLDALIRAQRRVLDDIVAQEVEQRRG
ncbi:MAG: helix-turn-helix domain-containing protein [Actinomycetota bacterium]|nr:helix-turn-helix domain-containing protein [Actinomycetota bacterium]